MCGPPLAGTIGGPWEEGGPSRNPPPPVLIHPCPPPPPPHSPPPKGSGKGLHGPVPCAGGSCDRHLCSGDLRDVSSAELNECVQKLPLNCLPVPPLRRPLPPGYNVA